MNPTLRKLGFSETDRVVILHADDIGSCQSSISAYADLLDFGVVSSAAAMVPCPWFPAAAAFCRANAGHPRLDMGVHLTLTSEWDTYRWGPVAVRDPQSGLLDAEGYFPRLAEQVETAARLDAMELELRAQIDRALAAGIDVTHVDTHMLTLLHPGFVPLYLKLSRDYRLPAFVLRPDWKTLAHWGYDWSAIADAVLEYEAQGFPLFECCDVLSLDRHDERLAEARQKLQALPPGLSYFCIHPCHNTPELRAFAPDWPCRVADYELFTSEAWRQVVAASGVHVLDFGALRDVVREA